MKVLLISDNSVIYRHFVKLLKKNAQKISHITFDHRYSHKNDFFAKKFKTSKEITPLNLLDEVDHIIKTYDLVISLHSKQIFPEVLVKKVRCINFHPGLNPYNRGWFPHIFSMVNGHPAGATIHEVDERLDHGPIIAQKEVVLTSFDTSSTAYRKILKSELQLIDQYFQSLIDNTYTTTPLPNDGNINYKKTFEELCEIDLKEKGTFEQFFNKLRALSHVGYNNAYIIDPKTKQKLFLELKIKKERKLKNNE